MPRLLMAAFALLLTVTGLGGLTTSPATAGGADDSGVLVAGIYNSLPVPLTFSEAWSQYGFDRSFRDAPAGGSALFGMTGSPITRNGLNSFCVAWSNTYNGWFTYRAANLPDGTTEYVTISIYGTRQEPTIAGCAGVVYPQLDVFFTSTPPPSTWRFGATLPHVLNKFSAQLTYEHNAPTLFDQKIELRAAGPGVGTPAIVSIGDSSISGEGGRWAGNTNDNGDVQRIDAGADWYFDAGNAESTLDCHRSKSAEVHIDKAMLTPNFACSGAETFSQPWFYPEKGWRWKPGVDRLCSYGPDQAPPPTDVDLCSPKYSGQVTLLQQFAQTHNVKTVVVAVGANDFGFGDVWRTCALIYAEQLAADTGETCQSNNVIQNAITPEIRSAVQTKIWNSLKDVVYAMSDAGYDRSQYTVILQNYWSAVPDDPDMRYSWRDRLGEGGCPLLNGDATALNHELLAGINETVRQAGKAFRLEQDWPTIRFLDVSSALVGHRLCEKGVSHIEDAPNSAGRLGTDPSMADKLEWVNEARSATVVGAPYTLPEGGHANYWGQLAERNCLRQAYNGGNPVSGKCVPATGGGVDSQGEPNMVLQNDDNWYQ
jgi:hypothetical protein